jgi:periplasmic protein CpxP/Spy
MSKHFLLVLIAAGLITVGTTFAAAQDSMSHDQQASSQDGEHMHHGMDPAKRTAELTKKLNLTSDQQGKVQSILQSEKSQMESLHQDSSTSQQDRRSKMMDIHKTSSDQIRGLLDSNQQKKWDEMQAKREQWMQKREGSQNKDQSAPPQQ